MKNGGERYAKLESHYRCSEPDDLNEKLLPEDSSKEGFITWPMVTLFTVMGSVSIALNADSPILPHMAREQLGVSEEDLGYTVGVIQGSYSFAQVLSSFFWGHMCDKWGRKPVLVIGLLACSICTMSFGISSTFTSAVLIRFFMGLANSNVSLARSSLADLTLTMDATKRNLVFAYLGASFSLARSLSTALTGAMASIPHEWFFPSYPFFFPMAVASLPIFFTLAVVLFSFSETRTKSPPSRHSLMEGLTLIRGSPLVLVAFGLFGLGNLCNAGMLICLVLFAAAPAGLNLTVGGVATCFWIFGSVGFVFQFTFFKRVVGSLGIRRTYACGGGLLTLACVLLPCSALPLHWDVAHARLYSWLMLVPALCCCSVGFMTLLPCVNVMMVNAADPTMFGLTSGTGQSLGALTRGLGPIVFGALFSAVSTRPYLSFVALAALYFPNLIFGLCLSEELERSRTEAQAELDKLLNLDEENNNGSLADVDEEEHEDEQAQGGTTGGGAAVSCIVPAELELRVLLTSHHDDDA